MATVFQGGYVGGPTSRPIDLSPIQQGLDARNQRLDAIPMAEFERYGPVGLAHKAAVGDESAERFLNRYYGGDTWRRFIPKIEDKEVVNPETGETEMVRGFTPPPGSAWDPQQMQRYSMDYFGFEFPQGGAPAESEQRVVTSDEQVVTAKEKTKGTQPPEQPTPDEVLATTRVHEGASDTAEVAPPVAVRDGASAIDRSGTQDQLMAGSDDVAGALQYKADIVERRAGAAFNETDPAQRTAAMVESEVIPALVEYMATPGRGLAGHEGGNPFAPGGLVDQIVAQRVGEEGISYLDASQPGTWRDAIRNRVRDELSAQGLDQFGTPLSPAERTAPTLTPGPGTRVDDQSSLSPGAWDHNIGAPVGGPTSQVGGVRTDVTSPVAIERGGNPQTGAIQEVLRVGDEAIPITNERQHTTAQRVQDMVTAPAGSPRQRGATAALTQTVRQESHVLRETISNTPSMRPAGAFARQVDQYVRANPAEASMYFGNLANAVLEGRKSEATAAQLMGQARESDVRARQGERELAAIERRGPEYEDAMVNARIAQLNAETRILEAQADIAPRMNEAELSSLFAKTDLTKEQRRILEPYLQLEFLKLDLQERIANAQYAGGEEGGLKVLLNLFKTDYVQGNDEFSESLFDMLLQSMGAGYLEPLDRNLIEKILGRPTSEVRPFGSAREPLTPEEEASATDFSSQYDVR